MLSRTRLLPKQRAFQAFQDHDPSSGGFFPAIPKEPTKKKGLSRHKFREAIAEGSSFREFDEVELKADLGKVFKSMYLSKLKAM